jgi:rhodanese-related sulfurtransferase
VREITVQELETQRDANNAQEQRIDVRSATEYAAGHVPGAFNIPLEQLEARLDDIKPKVRVLLICQSGTRARVAAGVLEQCRQDVAVLAGGTSAWARAGLPLVEQTSTRWSLERQVRLAAGLMVVLSTLLGLLVHRYWLGLAGFVGLGLTFAGITDLCPMGVLLAEMAWNRSRKCAMPAARPEVPGPPGSQNVAFCELGHSRRGT